MIHSASAINDAETCLRKWAWRKIEGVRALPNASAQLGTLVHSQIEAHLRDGTPLDLRTVPGQIAMAGAHAWPRDAVQVETRFEIAIEGERFLGFVDATAPGLVIDHKTTSDLRWAKAPIDLVSDVQATLYAHWRMTLDASDVVTARWIYYRTRAPYRALPVEALLTRASIAPRLDATARLAKALRVVAESGARALDLPPNATACDRYGGCPHIERCNLTDKERLRSIMTTQDLLNQLHGMINPGALPAAPAAAPVANTARPNPPEISGGVPEGLFWLWNGTAWILAPIRDRATLDPDGSRAFAPTPTPAPAPTPTPAPAPPTPAPTPAPEAKRGPGRPRKVDAAPAPTLGEALEAAAPKTTLSPRERFAVGWAMIGEALAERFL